MSADLPLRIKRATSLEIVLIIPKVTYALSVHSVSDCELNTVIVWFFVFFFNYCQLNYGLDAQLMSNLVQIVRKKDNETAT